MIIYKGKVENDLFRASATHSSSAQDQARPWSTLAVTQALLCSTSAPISALTTRHAANTSTTSITSTTLLLLLLLLLQLQLLLLLLLLLPLPPLLLLLLMQLLLLPLLLEQLL